MKLQQLFIFNPTLSTDEDSADENILCYYPADTSLDWQMNEVGFCSAIVRMQERFGAVAAIGSPMGITLSSKRYIIVKVEHNVFITVVVNREAFRNVFKSQAHHVTVWDSSLVTASQDDVDDVAQDVVARLVVTFYRMFAMMFGSITSNYNKIFGSGLSGQSPASPKASVGTPQQPRSNRTPLSKPPSSSANFRKSADISGKKRLQHALRAVMSAGLMDKLVPVLTETMKAHDLEGTFATPAGVEVLPLYPDTYLQITALMGHLSTAHASSITNAVVSVGPKVAYSSLSVGDTVTLFQLMLHYEEKTRMEKLLKAEEQQQQQRNAGDSSRSVSSPFLADGGETAQDGPVTRDVGEWWYSPDEIVRSERRRSEFLWTRQSDRTIRVPGSSTDNNTGGSSSRFLGPLGLKKQRKQATSEGPQKDLPEEYPFIFIDDEPRGVITMTIGAFKVFLLVRDKFLQHPQLREGLISSVERTLSCSHVGTPLQSYTSPGAEKARILDNIILFHFQSQMIRQVKSSIVARLLPVTGSLCAPASLPAPQQPLKIAERVLIHRLDMLREAVQRDPAATASPHHPHRSGDMWTLCRVTDDTWASHIVMGPRELSTAVLAKESAAEAEAALNGLVNYVFYFSLKTLS
jgi:hypothetical protein